MGVIKGLAYVGIESSDLCAWQAFAKDLLGLQANLQGSDCVTYRMDSQSTRLLIEKGSAEDVKLLGWEAAPEVDIGAVAMRLKDAGCVIKWGSIEEANKRGVERFLWFAMDGGLRLEVCQGLASGQSEFRSPSGVSGFVTGELGMGHAAVRVLDAKPAQELLTAILEMQVSDQITVVESGEPEHWTLLSTNARHHSIALVSGGHSRQRAHHVMIEVATIDDLGFAFDRAREHGSSVVRTLGRHSYDKVYSFYVASPSGFPIEVGFDSLLVDDWSTWSEKTHTVPSVWGHRRPEESEIRQGWDRQRKLQMLRAAKESDKPSIA